MQDTRDPSLPTRADLSRSSLDAMISTQLAGQLQSSHHRTEHNDPGASKSSSGQSSLYATRTPSRSPSKSRSFSDSTPKLSPSPKFRETVQTSKDDHAIVPDPTTPRRPDFLRGLSLQMPLRETSIQSSANVISRVPLSPQLDARNIYGSSAKVLPRHSRGLDFSRACTNLHHSTLAEQSSPDSSPVITQKGLMIPPRKGLFSSITLDQPYTGLSSAWGTAGNADKTTMSSSVGSINMLDSDSSGSDSEECDPMEPEDNDDAILVTPQVHKLGDFSAPTPYASVNAGPGGGWTSNLSPAPNFSHFRRTHLRKGRSRKSSSSASNHSAVASPGPLSPPLLKSTESSSGGYFAREIVMRTASSRRESLSLHTHDLHISSGNDSGDEAGMPAPSTPGVVRRAVTRRGNLLVSPSSLT